MAVENSIFENNTSSALYRYISQNIMQPEEGFQQADFTMSLGYGGAIVNHSNAVITDSIFTNNVAAQMGGAIFND